MPPMPQCCLALVLALLLPAVAAAEVGEVKGTVTQDGRTMELSDGVAVRSPQGDEIRLYLYPATLNDRDVQRARAGEAWAIALSKRSPNPQLWQHCPSMEVELNAFSKRLDSRGDLSIVNLIFNGLASANRTVTINRSGDRAKAAFSTLEIDTRAQSVTIAARNTGVRYGESSFSWDFRATLPIVDQKEPELNLDQ